MQPILFTLNRLHLNTAGTGVRKRGIGPMRPSMPLPAIKSSLTGISRDASGAPLGGCTVTLFRVNTASGFPVFTQVDTQVSDGSGNWNFVVGLNGPYRVTYDLDGSPVRAGITLNTLMGTGDGR